MATKPTKLDRINQLQRQLIIHSALYYLLDSPLWTDAKFDEASLELVELMKLPISKKSSYYKAFIDFDASTGMHLPYVDYAYAIRKARQLLCYRSKNIELIGRQLFERAEELVSGVDVDLNAPLDDEVDDYTT